MLSQRSAGRLLSRSPWSAGSLGLTRSTSRWLQPRQHPLIPATARPPTTATPRTQSPNVSGSRPFSWSSITGPTADAMMAVHSATGIPWFALIPLIAISFNLVMYIPMQYPSRVHSNRMARLTDVRLLWHARARRLDLAEPGKRATKEFERVLSDAGVTLWKSLRAPLVYIPTWIIFTSSFRHLAIPATSSLDSAPALLDPSFATEGALWFQNLAAPDPTYILPAAVGATLLWNAAPKSMAEARRLFDMNAGGMSLRFQRTMIFITPFMLSIITGLPTSVLLFWLTTNLSNRLLKYLADPYMPPRVKNPWTVAVNGNRDPWYVGGPK